MYDRGGVNILDMDGSDLKQFLFEKDQYLPLELPEYFQLEKALTMNILNPSDKNKTNYSIKQRKHGNYDWRTISIINPIFYKETVQFFEENWDEIVEILTEKIDHFKENIEISSIPFKSHHYKKIKGASINNWYLNFEQKSLFKSFKYQYCQMTDIENCYPSIYTHSIAWALHGKSKAKDNRKDDELIGNKLDKLVRAMQDDQTNGIPQGGVLTDIIAEIILIDVDDQLYSQCEDIKDSYSIIRYRDDYRIFSNSQEVIEKVFSELLGILEEYNLMINSEKTVLSTNFSADFIKNDKKIWKFIEASLWYRIGENKHYKISAQNHLLFIKEFADKHPGSGQISVAINHFYNRLLLRNYSMRKNEIDSCLVILRDLLISNVNAAPFIIACIHILFQKRKIDSGEVKEFVSSILKITKNNNRLEYVEIWIQYLAILWNINNGLEFSSGLCCLAQNPDEVSIFGKLIKNKHYSSLINKQKKKELVTSQKIKKILIKDCSKNHKCVRYKRNCEFTKIEKYKLVNVKSDELVDMDIINDLEEKGEFNISELDIFKY